VNYYPFHIGDYAVHTRHLTLLEDLAYRRLLDLYYTHDGHIPAEIQSVCRLLGMREHETEVDSVLTEFFVREEAGKWTHTRCEEEIVKAKAASERARINGKAGGRPAGSKSKTKPKENPAETHPVSSDNPEESESKAPITQDQDQIDKRPIGLVGGASVPPRCPVQDVVDLYHELLPELSRVKLMNDKRRKAIGAWWRWVLSSKKTDGTRRAQTADQALGWIRDYFERARDNDFLMGRRNRSGDHANWQCDLDFLLTERGMKHVIEKTREAA